MSILEKAAELAAELENCDELKEVREAEAIVRANPEADALMARFFESQSRLQELQMRGERIDDAMVADLNEIQAKMEENELVKRYYLAQEELGVILQQVNGMLSRALSGEEGCDPSSCASCSGC